MALPRQGTNDPNLCLYTQQTRRSSSARVCSQRIPGTCVVGIIRRDDGKGVGSGRQWNDIVVGSHFPVFSHLVRSITPRCLARLAAEAEAAAAAAAAAVAAAAAFGT